MRKSRIRHTQKQKMSAKMKLVIGASVFTAAFAAFLMIDLSDTETSMAEELTGEYRVVGSGEWDDQELWQVYNGSEWVPADEVPGKSANTIIVSEGSELVVTEEATMNKIIIEKGARLVLSANSLSVFKMGGKGGIDCKGVLDMDECIIEGNGDFKISDDAVLHIGSPEGIDKRSLSGNIQIRGAVELSRKATYVYDGNVRQSVGNGLPASVGEIRINNTSGVFMQTDISANVLNLEQGVLFTGPNVVRIGTSPSSPGSIVRKSGCVQGSLNKWYGAEKLESLTLPMGDEGGVSLFRFNTAEPSFSRGLIEMKYHPGKPDENFVSPFAAKEIKVGITEYGYFTARLTNGPEEALLQNEGTKVISSAETVSTWKMIRNNSGGAKSDEEPKIMTDFLLGPNPFSQSFTLTFSATEATMATIQLVNKAGKVVASEIMPVESGKNKFQFSDGADMAAGDYVIRISNPMEIHTLVASKK